MSIQARREKERNQRISAIKKSAWKIFLRDGLNNAKISEIAKDCSLGLATLYYYFKDKRQIVYSLMLDYKNDNYEIFLNLITRGVPMHEFLDGFVNAYLDNFERFRFFVLADSFYNYHRQYDLSDTVIRQYDTDTKKHGEFVISCFNSNISPDMFEKTKVGISMIIGFLRRYALIPQNSWPRTEEEKISMINNFKDLVNVVFQNIGFDLESHMIFPENHVP